MTDELKKLHEEARRMRENIEYACQLYLEICNKIADYYAPKEDGDTK